jgi:hypothetical protein
LRRIFCSAFESGTKKHDALSAGAMHFDKPTARYVHSGIKVAIGDIDGSSNP